MQIELVQHTLTRVIRHLARGFLDDVQHLVVVVLGGEGGEVPLQEDKADDVFKRLDVGMFLIPAF